MMSTPMIDLPDHFRIGVDKNNWGPVDPDDPAFDRYECWCGKPGCELY